MTDAVVFKTVDIVFGNNPQAALAMVDQGKTRDEIGAATGLVDSDTIHGLLHHHDGLDGMHTHHHHETATDPEQTRHHPGDQPEHHETRDRHRGYNERGLTRRHGDEQ